MTELVLSTEGRVTAGVLLLSVLAVQSGGFYMLQIVGRKVPATGFQIAFARAGHAHAGVLVVFGLLCQLFVDTAGLGQPWASVARSGVPLAAILMPAGFFFSSMGGRSHGAEPVHLAGVRGCPLAVVWRGDAGDRPPDLVACNAERTDSHGGICCRPRPPEPGVDRCAYIPASRPS